LALANWLASRPNSLAADPQLATLKTSNTGE
jgi:hypothetical protein